MNKIRQLTEVIRSYDEGELCYGTLKTLKMIDEEADRLERVIKQLTKQLSPVDFTDKEAEIITNQIMQKETNGR